MKRDRLDDLTTQDLVDLFAQIAVAQDNAILGGQIATFNKLYRQMKDVSDELKGRPGDQRRELMQLFSYPNMQVRLKAAVHVLAIAPEAARGQLQIIAEAHWYPQTADARGILMALDSGRFKPT